MALSQTRIGLATAYGYAKSQGFAGTEEEFAEYLAAASTKAGETVTNALKAEGYAVGTQNGTPVSSGSPYFNNNAEYFMEICLALTGKYPRIGSNGNWEIWNATTEQWVDTETPATGEDGVSPTITISSITGGHRVTITDATGDHSFDVMDGQPGGVQDVQVNGVSVLNNGVANVPLASTSAPGAVRVDEKYGIRVGAGVTAGFLLTNMPDESIIKAYNNPIGTTASKRNYQPITSSRLKAGVFYGLSEAAGDTTQSSSSNAVGTYTEDAKSKISDMLNAPVSVSGSTPTITAKSGITYKCGEVSTLSVTLPASGDVEIIFESGSTATVLTLTPPTGVTEVVWADGFDPTSLEANTRYDLIITDGEYGVSGSWAV